MFESETFELKIVCLEHLSVLPRNLDPLFGDLSDVISCRLGAYLRVNAYFIATI